MRSCGGIGDWTLFISMAMGLGGSWAMGSALQTATYQIEGYRRQSNEPERRIEVHADSAAGIGDIGFEELSNARIRIQTKNFVITCQGKSVLFKPEQIVLSKNASVKVEIRATGKPAFEAVSLPPEDRLSLSLDTGILKAPAARVEKLGKPQTGRSLYVELEKRQLRWFHGPSSTIRHF